LSNVLLQNTFVSAKKSEEKAFDMARDQFGFKKLILVTTASGKVFALDSTKGAIIWTRFFAKTQFTDLITLRTSVVKFPPVVAVVGSERLVGKDVTTIIRNLDGTTGKDFCSGIDCSARFPFATSKVLRLPFETDSEKLSCLGVIDGAHEEVCSSRHDYGQTSLC
jgi:hypothetical protein